MLRQPRACLGRLAPCAPLGLLLVFVNAFVAHAQTIAFKQVNYAVPQTPQSVVQVRYTGVQTAGNLNVVAIGWSDGIAHVSSVSDTSGNTYVAALAPTVQGSSRTHVIYYAANIAAAAANANLVTVTFDAAVSFPDIRIAEFSGIATVTPVEAAVGASGTGTTSNSGAVTTTSANVLLVGANNVQKSTRAAGSGFMSRVITSPDGDILEDRIVTASGSYSATAALNGNGGWVMQMVAFRSANTTGDSQPPTPPTQLAASATSGTQI